MEPMLRTVLWALRCRGVHTSRRRGHLVALVGRIAQRVVLAVHQEIVIFTN